jgi:hypothetical protein
MISLCLSAQYQASSGHYIELSIVQKMDLLESNKGPNQWQ